MFKSLRWRIQAWYALILLIVLAGFGGVLYAELSRARLDEIDSELVSAARVLEGVLRTTTGEGGLDRGRVSAARVLEGVLRTTPQGRRPPPLPLPIPGLFPGPDRPGDDRMPPPATPDGRQGPPPPPRPWPGMKLPRNRDRLDRALSLPDSFVSRNEERGARPYAVIRTDDKEVIHEEPPGAAENMPPDHWVGPTHQVHPRNRGFEREITLLGPARTTITVGRNIERELSELDRLAWQLGLTGLSVFAVGLLGGWWLSARAVRPIVSMSRTISGIQAGNLSQRLDLTGVDTELGSLGRPVNQMLERLEQAFSRQVRFTADASHELRTPLAVVLSQVELALARPREAAAYQESLEACGRAAHRMKLLVEDLLTLARTDSGNLELHMRPVDLAHLAAECVALIEPLARQKEIQIVLKASPAPLRGDPERLIQVLINLMTNAMEYNQPGGKVEVVTSLEAGQAFLQVIDTGKGIPESELPRIFDRFHRADAARSRATGGGSGLGLAICQGIIQSHQGSISATSVPGKGTTFTVSLPQSLETHEGV